VLQVLPVLLGLLVWVVPQVVVQVAPALMGLLV
jgi:hypothetical protein